MSRTALQWAVTLSLISALPLLPDPEQRHIPGPRKQRVNLQATLVSDMREVTGVILSGCISLSVLLFLPPSPLATFQIAVALLASVRINTEQAPGRPRKQTLQMTPETWGLLVTV